MKFLIQYNLINEDHLKQIEKVIQKYPHVFVNVVPFSREIIANESIEGQDFIPYGSTLLTTLGVDYFKNYLILEL